MGGVWFQFMGREGGGYTKDDPVATLIRKFGRTIVAITPLHRVPTGYDWTQEPGYSNIETCLCMEAKPPLSLNKIKMGGLAPDELRPFLCTSNSLFVHPGRKMTQQQGHMLNLRKLTNIRG